MSKDKDSEVVHELPREFEMPKDHARLGQEKHEMEISVLTYDSAKLNVILDDAFDLPVSGSASASDIASFEREVAIRNSAHAKLAKLGFTDEELESAFGIEPPSSRQAWLSRMNGEKPNNGNNGNGPVKKTIKVAAP